MNWRADMIALVVSVFLLSAIANGATISGKVTDKESSAPLIGANVVVMGTKLGAATDVSGRYSIKNVPPGRIILRTSYVGYRSIADTVTVVTSDGSLTVDLRLPREAIPRAEFWDLAVKALSPRELHSLQAYQDSLAFLASRSRVLTVRLDTLDCISKEQPYGGEMRASLTFHNNTAVPVYLLKNYPCMRRLHADIVDSTGDTVRSREMFVDMVGEQCHYDSSDLIVVPPHGESRYPKSTIWLQSCGTLPDKWCTIRIIYSYELPKVIYETSTFRPSQVVPYLRAVRGTFACENVMVLHGEKRPPQATLLPMEVIVTNVSAPKADSLVTLEGTLRDSTTGEKLEGAWIVLRRTRRTTHTNVTGEFRLDSLSTRDTLIINHVTYPKKILSLGSIPLPFQQAAPASVNLESAISKIDSADIDLIRSCLREDSKNYGVTSFRDSAAKIQNVFILDSLIHSSWLPQLPGVRFLPKTSREIGDLVTQGGVVKVTRLLGLYKRADVRTIVLETGDYYLSRKNSVLRYAATRRDRYMYRLLEGSWRLWLHGIPLVPHGIPVYE